MSVRNPKTIHLIQQRTIHQLGRTCGVFGSQMQQLNRLQCRNFGHFRNKWYRMHYMRHFDQNGRNWHKYGGSKDYYKRYGKRFGHWRAYRSAGLFMGGMTMGSCLGMIISYDNYHSIVWAVIHGFLSWIYVIYYALSEYNKQDMTANELITIQVNEVSDEIEKLNKIYLKIVKEMDSNDSDIKGKLTDGVVGSSGSGLDPNREVLDGLKAKIDKLSDDIASIKNSD